MSWLRATGGRKTLQRSGRPSPSHLALEVGQALLVVEQAAERVTDLGDAIGKGPYRPVVALQVGVLEFIPLDRNRDRSAGSRSHAVGRGQCLVDGVLGVVETGQTLTSALFPRPADQLRNG